MKISSVAMLSVHTCPVAALGGKKTGPAKALEPIEIFPFLDEFTANVISYQRQHQTRYDLIHAHYWLSGLVGLKLKIAWKIPLTQTFHTLGLVKQRFMPDLTEPPTRIAAEKQLVKMVNRILAFTADEVNHLQNSYGADPGKITVIPPGVDVNRFRPIASLPAKTKIKIPRTRRLILFVGRLDPIKRVEVLLKAFKRVNRRRIH